MKFKITLSGLATVAANLVPLLLAALGYWGITEILTLYWAETAIVGVFAILRMLCASGPMPVKGKLKPLTFQMLKTGAAAKTLPRLLDVSGPLGRLLLAIYFSLPFVIFMLLSGLLLYIFFYLIGAYGAIPSIMSLKWGLLALAGSHAFRFIKDYLLNGEFRRTRPEDCYDAPIHRLAIMQLTLAGGAGAAHSFGNMAYVMCVFIIAKTALELRPKEGYIGGNAKL